MVTGSPDPKRDEDPEDRAWQHIEVKLPYAWYFGQPILIRFVISTRSAWDKTSHIGWLVDDIKIMH